MFNLKLSPPVNLFGQVVCSLEEAAYVIRQKAIVDNDSGARLFVRRLRDIEDLGSALLCEQQLRERAARYRMKCEMTTTAHARPRLARKTKGNDDND